MAEKRSFSEKERKAYIHLSQTRPCFICQLVAGNPIEKHNLVFENESVVVFFPQVPPLFGYLLLAPIQHLEHVTGDLTLDRYLEIQRMIYFFSEAVRLETGAERVYILSLGSQQGNSHVHWHIAPLPPGIPYEKQQFEALDSKNGVWELTNFEKDDLANRLLHRVHMLGGI